MSKDDDHGDVDEQHARAERLRRRIDDLRKPSGNEPDRLPGESDLAYVQRRMRELDRKPKDSSGTS